MSTRLWAGPLPPVRMVRALLIERGSMAIAWTVSRDSRSPDVFAVPATLLGRQPAHSRAERLGVQRLPAVGVEARHALVAAVECIAQHVSRAG